MRFLRLIKRGIIFGNVITLCGGYFLGSPAHINVSLLLMSLLGMSLVVASGCVFNNIIDRDIDRVMQRTRNRVMVKGAVSLPLAIAYGLTLALLGFFILFKATHLLALSIAAIGFFVYVVLYSLCFKRHSIHGTAIGGIAGSVPPLVGYCAVTNRLDNGALILFCLLFLWQMAHSYAIYIYRIKDYMSASIDVLPIKKGIRYTKFSMLFYVLAFATVSLMPSFFGFTGIIYFAVALVMGLAWLFLSIQGFWAEDDRLWSRRMFLFSLIIIMVLCLMMAIKW